MCQPVCPYSEVKGPPSFLMPEATKPLARNLNHAPPANKRKAASSAMDEFSDIMVGRCKL